jgi:hypothetical protein
LERLSWGRSVIAVACLLPTAPASARDDQGQELIGAIADAMLGNQSPGTIEKDNATRGGADILIEGRANLHAMWDDVPHDWGRNATPELLAKAKAVPPSKAQVDMLAALWAGETVRLSNNAFKGLTFGARNDQGKWPATVDNAFLYRTKLENMQRQQIIKGGARLAELLREIWPEE